MERFCLVRDEDCHWYLIPVSKKKEFVDLCDLAYKLEDQDLFDELDQKFGAMRTNPQTLTFTDPQGK